MVQRRWSTSTCGTFASLSFVDELVDLDGASVSIFHCFHVVNSRLHYSFGTVAVPDEPLALAVVIEDVGLVHLVLSLGY